jgi:hypothetical protein
VSLSRKQMLKIMVGTGVAAATGLPSGVAHASGDRGQVIDRDICVIGGGGSGTYAAIRLRDLGKSVVVVERANRLGGHTETYHDPVTGGSANFGVLVWHDLPVVHSYFDRLGVPIVPSTAVGEGAPKFADLRTGRIVEGYQLPVPTALPKYLELLQQYPYLEAGFDLPNPVPAELLLPFKDFVALHGLESVVPLVFRFGQGLGDLLNQPTLYVMKNFGIDVVLNIFNGSFQITKSLNNGELYEKAASVLGNDVLLNATLTSVERGLDGVELCADTPYGPHTIRAKKVVFTAPPVPGNLAPFDLDSTERALFSRFRPGFYYTAVMRLPGVPDDFEVRNVGADTLYNTPPLPGIYFVSPTGVPGLQFIKYGSTVALTDNQVKANILADLNKLQAAGTMPATKPKFEVFQSHSPFELTVSKADIAAGFYRNLYALQGHRNTFYTGAAFHTHDSSLLWRFTEALLPRITS